MFFFHLPSCVSQGERGMLETAKSVLGLEETARQLLFLHSSKSSLESNLPVCYCIQTTPQLQRYPSPSSLALASLLRSLQVYPLSPRAQTHTCARATTCTRAHTLRETVCEHSLLVSSLALERTNFACTRVALLFGNLTYVCLPACLLACGPHRAKIVSRQATSDVDLFPGFIYK